MSSGKNDKNHSYTAPQMRNKRAWFDYEILEKVEAGIELLGSEVRSLRLGGGDLAGAFARIQDNECWLVGCKIAPYEQAGERNHQPLRRRKLLLHKRQIRKIESMLSQKGFTIVPLSIYFSEKGLAKVEIGIARGKKKYDKREKITAKQQRKEMTKIKKYK